MTAGNPYLAPVITIAGSLLISAITNDNRMQITVVDSPSNTYIVGQLVKLIVPDTYGMFQADGLTGTILAIDGGVIFTLDIDSSTFDVFSVPASGYGVQKPASLCLAGSRNLEFNNDTRLVPFQSLNNIGN